MQPFIGPISATTFGWLLGAVLTGGLIVWSTRETGLAAKGIVLLLLGCTVALLVGAKALYILESVGQWDSRTAFSEQVRLPGGVIAVLLLSPWFPRSAHGSRWQMADIIAPALGLLILGTRIGCFLQGCCYGKPSTLPWALPFPRGSEVHDWQIQNGIVSASAMQSVPVQPLQLYFAIAGALLFLVLVEYQDRKRYTGEVALLFTVSYLWSTWLLERLRAQPHWVTQRFTLLASLIATGILVYIEAWRLLRTRGAATSRAAENA
jgi:phosphatidylglycerol:prolipoprotein diacylglycerol transferase